MIVNIIKKALYKKIANFKEMYYQTVLYEKKTLINNLYANFYIELYRKVFQCLPIMT